MTGKKTSFPDVLPLVFLSAATPARNNPLKFDATVADVR